MQGWAKGLKDRVERTATQLSQVSATFTPPTEGDGVPQENGDSAHGDRPDAATTSDRLLGTPPGGDGNSTESATGLMVFKLN